MDTKHVQGFLRSVAAGPHRPDILQQSPGVGENARLIAPLTRGLHDHQRRTSISARTSTAISF